MMHNSRAGVNAALLIMALAVVPAFAAERLPADEIEMSAPVRDGLNAVIAAMDAGRLDEAAATLALLRASNSAQTAYEQLVVLQTSASLNMTRQNYAEAAADYEAILQLPELAPDARVSSANLAGQLYMQLANWNKGLEHMLTTNELQGGTNMETLFRVAFAYAQLGQTPQAIDYMQQALAAGGENIASYQLNLAVLYMQARDTPNAIATYEKALEFTLDPADRELVLANLASLHIGAGSAAQARLHLESLVREYPDSDQIGTYRQSLEALGGG